MKKVLNIAWKDVRIAFRDPAALMLMLATPFGLILVMGLALGGFGGSRNTAGLSEIPVVIVNHDAGQLGENLVQVFQSKDLSTLIAPEILQNDAEARGRVDEDRSAAAVIIPEDLTRRVIPSGSSPGGFSSVQTAQPAVIEVYANPTRPVSASVVRSIVDAFLEQVNVGIVAGRISVEQLVRQGLLSAQQAEQAGAQVGEQAARQAIGSQLVGLEEVSAATNTETSNGFDWLAFIAPSMAILFLMFTVTAGGRSILAERDAGTLPRMLVSPSRVAHVLGGKILGIFLTGLAQVSILIIASRLLLGVRWGDLAGTAVLTVAVVLGASGWGTLLAAYSRTPGQANAIGTALALVFGAAAGNFVPRQALPVWLQTASLISPNAWGLEGFMKLGSGGALGDIWGFVAALTGMAAITFGLALLAFRRQYA